MSEWLTHPSGEYRRVGNAIHVRYWAAPGVTDMYPVPADPRVEELERERDRWQNEAERLKWEADEVERRVAQLTDERDRMTAQRDEAVRKAASLDALRPLRMEVPAELFEKPSGDVDELRAVIVSQAREIARLKGESK